MMKLSLRNSVTKQDLRGARGRTNIQFDPATQRSLIVNGTMDVMNCPHCGVGHASAKLEQMHSGSLVVRCPALGGKAIALTFTVKASI